MYRKRFTDMNCSIARSLDEVGEWWSLLIVRDCTQGSRRFDEVQRELWIARNILTARLARLIELGIIEKFPLEDRANTDGYRLTPKGEQLFPVLIALKQWGDCWIAEDGKERITLVDEETGQPVDEIAVQNTKRKKLSFRDVRFAPGPAATATTRAVIEERNSRVLGEKRKV